MNSSIKYVLYFATHWQLNRTLLLHSPASPTLPFPEGSVGCQGKSHLSDIFEVRSMVRKWEIAYPKGKEKVVRICLIVKHEDRGLLKLHRQQ